MFKNEKFKKTKPIESNMFLKFSEHFSCKE